MNREFFYISLFNNDFLGDDGAVVGKSVYSVDAFCEGIHFKRDWFRLKEIAQKAMLVNISDAVAMNAKPLYALISIAIPKEFTPKELEELAEGFKEIAKEWGIKIIGGDTIASNRLDISITIIATTKKALLRKPIKEGYLIGYTGDLGSVRRDLKRAFRGKRPSSSSKFTTPRLRLGFIKRTSRLLRATMDISDGLFDDLAKLSRLNRKGFSFFKRIAKSIGCSGEEYEILFAIAPRDKRALIERAKKSRTKVTFVAKAIRGRFKNICKPHHF